MQVVAGDNDCKHKDAKFTLVHSDCLECVFITIVCPDCGWEYKKTVDECKGCDYYEEEDEEEREKELEEE